MHPIDQAIAEMQARRRARTCYTARMIDLAQLTNGQLLELATERGIPGHGLNRRGLIMSVFLFNAKFGY